MLAGGIDVVGAVLILFLAQDLSRRPMLLSDRSSGWALHRSDPAGGLRGTVTNLGVASQLLIG